MFGFGKNKEIEFVTPLAGEIIKIDQVEDPVFAEKMMGDGFAIMPTDGKVYAPIDGEVASIFPTGHAIGIKQGDKLEVLIHFGLETVKLKGEGFTRIAQEGQAVKAGDTVIEFDLALLEEKAKSTLTPVVISNMDEIKELHKLSGSVTLSESTILRITK